MFNKQRCKEVMEQDLITAFIYACRKVLMIDAGDGIDYDRLKEHSIRDDFKKAFLKEWQKTKERLCGFLQKAGKDPSGFDKMSHELEEWIEKQLRHKKENFTLPFFEHHKHHLMKILFRHMD